MLNVPENELFSAYLDGELTAEEQAEMEHLLNTSPDARQLMDELRALSATLQSLPVVELEEDLSGRVLRAAERQMLSEPLGAEQAKGAPGRDTALRPHFLRRVLRGRTLWWSGVAVAVALFLAYGDSNDRARRPGGNDNHVAVDTVSSAGPGARVPEVSAIEDSDPHTVAAADSPAEERTVEPPTVKGPSRDEPANDAGSMIADSGNPTVNPADPVNPVVAGQPTPESVTTPDGSPEAAKPGDGVWIVKCDVSQKAADGEVLGEILAKRKIARLNRTDTGTGKVLVEVDLTPTQLRDLVADLESRREHFVAVSVPSTPGAARPRIPSAAEPPKKATGTVRVGPATSAKVGATGNGKGLTGSASALGGKSEPIQGKIDGQATVSKPPQQTDKPVGKSGGVKRSTREERKFRVRFELNVVAPATPESGNGTSSAPSEQADPAPKNEK